jgi:hypothetical protein
MYDPFDTIDPEPSTEPMFDPETSDVSRTDLDQTGMNYEGVVSDGGPGTGRDFRDDLGTGRAGTFDDGLGTGAEYFEEGNGTEFGPSTYEL